jgi:ribosomal protein S18 acetylase RimI-like enzyme
MHIAFDSREFEVIQTIAEQTWPTAYGEILSEFQLRYMLDKFYSIDALQSQVHELKHQFLLATDKVGTGIGFASFSRLTQQNQKFRLHKLYVLPSYQGKGIGAMLLQKIETYIQGNTHVYLELNVNRFNPAIAFYQKLGFEIISTEDIDIGNGFFMNDYVMERQIVPIV